ncbi:MAG: DNRLRE domain-containing protein [bacterium]
MKQVVQRFFYTERGKHFLLAGVPWSWVRYQPKGTVVIDPSTAAATLDDVWLESAGNFNTHSAGLLVGNAGGGPSKKRTLVKFDLASAGLPADAEIVKAQLQLKYYGRSGSSWVDREVRVHQMLVDWVETQATRDNRTSTAVWSSAYGAIGADAKAAHEDSVVFTFNTAVGSWQYWDVSAPTRAWHSGSAPNFGGILLADNEYVVGYDLRFRSSDDGNVDQPVLEVIYTQPTRTVYFLKDHLGSIRATVDEIGQVVGYDDYDPWGFILAGRSMATGASTEQGATKNKFTGKEWDDEFGLNWLCLRSYLSPCFSP